MSSHFDDIDDTVPIAQDVDSEANDSNKTLSLLGGVAQPEDVTDLGDTFNTGGGKSWLGSGTLILVIVAAVTVSAIYAMRVAQGAIDTTIAAKEVERTIEKALAKLATPQLMPDDDPLQQANLDSLFSDTQTAITMFSRNPAENQVPVDFLKKNPFVLPRVKQPKAAAPVAVVSDRRDEIRREQLYLAVKKLKLQSVMNGRVPMAMINNDVVRVGHKVNQFTVSAITAMGVKLTADGYTFALTLVN